MNHDLLVDIVYNLLVAAFAVAFYVTVLALFSAN